MKRIESVAILGAGAMGASYASNFSALSGLRTVFIAGGDRGNRLRNNGVIVNGKQHRVPVVSPEEPSAPADLIIVALKNHHMDEAINSLHNIIHKDTIIISVMNGLESEQRLMEVYGKERVLYAVSVGIDAVRHGNSVTYSNAGKIVFGKAENSKPGAKVLMVQDALDRAGLAYETPVDMIRSMWWKFMINVGVNQASSVLRAPYGVFQSSYEARELMFDLMREVIALAQVIGVNLEEQDLELWLDVLYTLSPDGKTSMLQDIEAGRKTEVEAFASKVVELGEKHGLNTPVNKTILNIIKVLENRTIG